MPSIGIAGGGTNMERFKASLLDKIYGGASTSTMGHLTLGARAQKNLRQIEVQDANGNWLATADEAVADGANPVG